MLKIKLKIYCWKGEGEKDMIEDRIKIVKDELLDMKVDAIVNPTDRKSVV